MWLERYVVASVAELSVNASSENKIFCLQKMMMLLNLSIN